MLVTGIPTLKDKYGTRGISIAIRMLASMQEDSIEDSQAVLLKEMANDLQKALEA